jgi:phosphoribosylformylglycinamidine cyclo-ligase
VGTKLKLAFAMGIHDTVGIDLVAMCVNDCLVCGAEPLFFLDYYACSKLDPQAGADVVGGIAEGCRQAGCALVGGETAELPGFYQKEEYDLAGFCVGVVERSEILDGSKVRPGDAVLGLLSTGLHSNGFSLARAIVDRAGIDLRDPMPGTDLPIGKVLLTPTRIYVKAVLSLRKLVELRALAHITGGGLTENIPRTLPEGLGVRLQAGWPMPPVLRFLAEKGPVERSEMVRTFNMGIGMTAVLPAQQASLAIEHLRGQGVPAQLIGTVVEIKGDSPRVVIEGAV